MIRTLIADDHAIVRRGLKQVFELETDIVVDAEAENGHEALQKLRAKKFDVAVIDISMPGMNGLDLLKQIKLEFPDLPVLVLSIHPEDQYAVRMLKAGAAGYMTKETAPDELVTAVRKVSQGRRYVSAELAEKLAAHFAGDGRAPHDRLSDREFQVLCLLASGLTPTQIAKKLALSIKTVSTHRARLLEKMEMTSNAELIRYTLENGLLERFQAR